MKCDICKKEVTKYHRDMRSGKVICIKCEDKMRKEAMPLHDPPKGG